MKIRLNLHQIRAIILTIAIALLAGSGGYWLAGRQIKLELGREPVVKIERIVPAEKTNLDFALFWTVWDRLNTDYIDKSAINPSQMVYGAIQGMVASLKDPYTVFLKPQENKQTKEDLNGAFEGVGIQLGYKDGQLAVMAPIRGMPAERNGVRAGDLILKIDDQETTGLTLPEAVSLIRGPKGTKVKLALLHEKETQLYEVVLARETIVIPSVEVSFVDNVAHLKLMKFGDRTTDEWHQAVTAIINHQPLIKGIVLDLRNNPGGYLSGSVFIASEFLASGVVVQQEHADGRKESFSVDRQGKLIRQTLVLLVNKGSASASEIVAGALQESKRAKVVGEATFGKGTIQEAQDLPGGAGLHITTARWLLPSGKSVDKKGVIPDVEVKNDPQTLDKDAQLEKAMEVLLKS